MNLAIPINPIRRKKIIYTSLKVKDEYKMNWMRSIGYVPQKINLTGRTLRENITFKNLFNCFCAFSKSFLDKRNLSIIADKILL